MSVRRRSPLRSLYHALLDLLSDEWAIQLLYVRNFKRFADLRAPRTFSEKTNWRKLHQRDPRFTLYADKAAVKDEVARLIGREHIVPTLWTGERPEDIPFDELAPPYVVKVNHGYGSNLLIRRPEDVDRGKIRAALACALRHPHGRVTRQWAYYDIPRKIVIEPMLDIYGSGAPEDYKFFVYHGRARFVQIIVDRWGKNLVACYDLDWNKLDAPLNRRDIERPVPKPPFLDEMIAIAEKVGASFDFVRVDLYHASGKVYFGEATFYHSAGYSAVITGELDRVFGEPWNIASSTPSGAGRAAAARACGALEAACRAFLALLPDEWAIQLLYFRNFKRFADLRSPMTLSEKINWRKLHQRDPRFPLYSDKAAVKEEVGRLIGREHIVPTLWTGERPEDIPFDELAPPYVIKVNHGYGSNIFVRRPEDVDRKAIHAALRENLRHEHGRHTRQWGYYGIPRKILVERMLDILGGDEPEDYKFFVYHGRAHFIQVNVDRWGKDLLAYYDRDWERLSMPLGKYGFQRPIPKPPFLDEMIAIAEKVGASFDFVRVDLYHASGKVYFGETTFYHSAGYSGMFGAAFDARFGEPWLLPPREG